MFCLPLFCRYQDFVEPHQDPDPQVHNGRIMSSASLDGAEERQKTGVFCLPHFCRFSAQVQHLCQKPMLRPLDGIFAWRRRPAFNKNKCVGAQAHSQITTVVRATTECDIVPKGANPFYAFAH